MTESVVELTAPVSKEIRDQANALADAFSSPISIWRRTDSAGWMRVLEDAWHEPPAEFPAINEEAADRAVEIGAAVMIGASDSGDGFEFVAPLASRDHSIEVAIGYAATDHEATVRKLAASIISGQRRTEENLGLREENDTFASQLSSDLEELFFLRQMVGRLKDTAAAAELTGMARETLPVLNETVRATCLAFLVAPDPSKPFDVRVAYRIGATDPSDRRVAETVSLFGEQALASPLVRNWDTGASGIESDDSVRVPGVKSLVLCSLATAGKRFGWLAAINRRELSKGRPESSWQLASEEFGSGEATLIEASASILAMHAANLEMLREKEQIIVSVVRSMVAAIESKDPYTRGHSERVALYTKQIAEEMGFFEAEAEQIYLSGLLHDVGKIGVSDETLNKPGKLTEKEFAEIAKHPDEGWSILCDLRQLAYVLPGVLHHHERWDGNGYPDRLAGESIPIEGRIMAVADAFDAMTSDRSYRKGMPNEKAEKILRDGAGSQWDPAAVEAFFSCREDLYQIQASYEQRVRPRRGRNDRADGDPA